MTLEQKVIDLLIIHHNRTPQEAESAVASLLPEILAVRVDQALRDEETKRRNEKQWSNKK